MAKLFFSRQTHANTQEHIAILICTAAPNSMYPFTINFDLIELKWKFQRLEAMLSEWQMYFYWLSQEHGSNVWVFFLLFPSIEWLAHRFLPVISVSESQSIRNLHCNIVLPPSDPLCMCTTQNSTMCRNFDGLWYQSAEYKWALDYKQPIAKREKRQQHSLTYKKVSRCNSEIGLYT